MDRTELIVFSMGSVLNSTYMPEHFKEVFVQVLSKLPHTVIWRFEGDKGFLNRSKNILAEDWIPQRQLLSEFLALQDIFLLKCTQKAEG